MLNLGRFIDAQALGYAAAFKEIAAGKKTGHWMWYIFPQIKGLGHSETSKYFAIQNFDEAESFMDHPLLGERLIKISQELLNHSKFTATEIFGIPDDAKLRSSMTLFEQVKPGNDVFKQVLSSFFDGLPDHRTLDILDAQRHSHQKP